MKTTLIVLHGDYQEFKMNRRIAPKNMLKIDPQKDKDRELCVKKQGINVGDLFYLNQVNSAYSWTSDEYFEWYQNRNSWGGILSKSHAPTILYIDKGIFIYIGLKEKLIYKKDIYCHFYDILSKKNIYYYAVNINNFFKLCA